MDKKTVSAIFLIIVVVMAYQLVILPMVSPPPPPPETSPQAEQIPAPQVPAPVPAPVPALLPAALPPAGDAVPAALEKVPLPAVDVERREVTVEKPLYTAVIDNLRGGFRSWRLNQYSYSEKVPEAGGEQVEMLLPGPLHGALGVTFTDPLSESSFSTPLAVEEEGDSLVLLGADQYGIALKRTYRFNPDSYDVEMDITFENRSDTPRNLAWEIFVGPDLDKYRQETRGPDKPEAIAFAAGNLDKVKVKNPGEVKDVGPATWVGIGDRYFLSSLAAIEGSLTGFVRRNSESRYEVGYHTQPFTLLPRQIVTYRLSAFLGPKEQDRLSAYGIGLDRSVNYGWFSWLAKPFLSILKFFYRYLQNWGLAIIALTLVVKLALFPITQNMYRSMRKMQSLQPQIAALKKKFKDDSQTLHRETMALYKQYKVNPMAGCLPMVIQIPVFFALYRVLYNAIELRGASFLYIPDLSLKDPFYIAPLLMGATMILQQRMTPTSADPKQARMMMFMPIIFTAMFLNFSSGLVLYFLFSNIFAIGEQTLVRKWSSRSAANAPALVEKTAKRPGKKKKH